MIRLEHVSKHYGPANNRICAVHDVSLQTAPGDFVIITGASGSGKTTLLNLIGGMTRQAEGNIFVDGHDLAAMNDAVMSSFRACTIGFIFQFQSMLSTLNVLDNVLLPAVFADRQPDQQSALELLDQVGLTGRLKAYAHELSIGQQRRVSIVRALMSKPALLLCDEPTGDLDPESEAVIMGLLNLAHRSGTTVIMVTHNHGLCRYAARIFSCQNGCLSEKNTSIL